MTPLRQLTLAALLGLSLTSAAFGQTHRGRLDTDGILSPGEIPNRHIEYGYGRYAPPPAPVYRRPDTYPNGGWYGGHGNWQNHNGYGRNDRPFDRPGYGYGVGGSQFDRMLWGGVQAGRISQREEWELRDAQRNLQRLEYQYGSDGRISPSEQRELNERYSDLQGKFEHEMKDGERRY